MLSSDEVLIKPKVKTVAKRLSKKRVQKTKTISNTIGLDLPPLDEKYDEDTLAFLRTQIMYQVNVVNNYLEVKHSDGKEKQLKQGI